MARLASVSIFALLLSACVAGGPSSGPPPVSNPSAVVVDQTAAEGARATLNYYRSFGSIGPVMLDGNFSQGAQLHANYLHLNSVSLGVVGLDAHNEYSSYPGYTPQGQAAGQNSVIYEGVTPTQAVHNWMQTLYHRLGMMDPNLTRIGFGSQGPYQVMDIGQGRLRGWMATDAISLFPWPGMTDVAGSYVREIPHPIPGDDSLGIPITVEFFGTRGLSIVTPQVRLRDLTHGVELGRYVQSPGNPFLSQWDLRQLIAIIPHSPLPSGSVIQVEVTAIVDGGPFGTEWQFTTR